MGRFRGKNVVPKKSVDGFRGRQRENILIARQPIVSTERTDAPLQRFVARESVYGKSHDRLEPSWQPTPPVSVANTQVALVTPEQFIRSLTNEGNFHILSCALGDKIHRDDGRSRDWFFQTFHDLWK